MVIYRRIIKTKVKVEQGLRSPDITLPKGVNLRVLKYANDFAIIELWCSDKPILEPEEQKTLADLKALDKYAIEILKEHPESPKIIGKIAILTPLLTNPKVEIDEVTKTLRFKGRTAKFLRKETFFDTSGKERIRYILDEG